MTALLGRNSLPRRSSSERSDVGEAAAMNCPRCGADSLLTPILPQGMALTVAVVAAALAVAALAGWLPQVAANISALLALPLLLVNGQYLRCRACGAKITRRPG